MPQDISPEPHDLKKRSVAMSTVASTAVGAALGTAGWAMESWIDDERVSKGELAAAATIFGLGMGTLGYFTTKAHNRKIDNMRPYVERLEQEVQAKNATPAATPQK